MKKYFILFSLLLLIIIDVKAQINKGINFQGVARSNNGLIITNKVINLRLSIQSDSLNGIIEYQEVVSITTNSIGLFSVVVGSKEVRKILVLGNFENINWSNPEKYLKVEVDMNRDLNFIKLGIQKINYVPYAFYADRVDATNIHGILNIKKGGTGLDNLKDFKTALALDKVNNTADSVKPISMSALILLNEKLKKSDTLWLSNRINSKLNQSDTNYLSARINSKLNQSDTNSLSARIDRKLNLSDTTKIYHKINQIPLIDTTSLSARINSKLNKSDTNYLSARINSKLNQSDTNYLSARIDQKINIGGILKNDITTALNFTPAPADYGNFYDTSKQITAAGTANSIKFGFSNFYNNINITNNTSGLPSRITVTNGGIYNVRYSLQCIKTDANNDELSVWIRRNSAAYANTNSSYSIVGAGIKNTISNSFYVELGANDYVEIYFSVKNNNTSITGSNTQLSPSRPATPSAILFIEKINSP